MKRYLPTRAQDFATLVIAVAWLDYVVLAAAWGLQSYRSSNRAAEERAWLSRPDIAAGVATGIEGLPASAKVYIVDAEGGALVDRHDVLGHSMELPCEGEIADRREDPSAGSGGRSQAALCCISLAKISATLLAIALPSVMFVSAEK